MTHRTIATVGAAAWLILCAYAGYHAPTEVDHFTHYTHRELEAYAR